MDIEAVYKQLRLLAEQGSPGERELAARKLKEFEAKYRYLEQCEDTVTRHWFRWKNLNEDRLLLQICYKVLNHTEAYVRRKPGSRATKEIGVECTESEAMLIDYLFSFYRELYSAELEVFFHAFVQKHQLFGNKTPEANSNDDNSDMDRILSMMRALKSASPHQALPVKDE